jgi:vanillate/3-O-methylgallate O-demethylase
MLTSERLGPLSFSIADGIHDTSMLLLRRRHDPCRSRELGPGRLHKRIWSREREAQDTLHRVLSNGAPVGVATSRGYSFYFREVISLCTIDLSHSEIGADVTVIWGSIL